MRDTVDQAAGLLVIAALLHDRHRIGSALVFEPGDVVALHTPGMSVVYAVGGYDVWSVPTAEHPAQLVEPTDLTDAQVVTVCLAAAEHVRAARAARQ
jgi:hypothetical protein